MTEQEALKPRDGALLPFTLKFRASSNSALFTGETKANLTEIQERDLNVLLAKGDSITEAQIKTRNTLIAKRDAPPELPAGAKTYIECLVEQQVYEYDDHVYTPQMQKGHLAEDEIIDLYNTVYFTSHKKCPDGYRLENEFFTGHPDVECEVTSKYKDAKASWNKKTHPKTVKQAYDSGYEWQVRTYLYLKRYMIGLRSVSCETDTRWTQGEVFFGLVDTPDQLLRDFDDLTLHEVNHLPLGLRLTCFPVTLTDKNIEFMESRAKMGQKYAQKYYNELMTKAESV